MPQEMSTLLDVNYSQVYYFVNTSKQVPTGKQNNFLYFHCFSSHLLYIYKRLAGFCVFFGQRARAIAYIHTLRRFKILAPLLSISVQLSFIFLSIMLVPKSKCGSQSARPQALENNNANAK